MPFYRDTEGREPAQVGEPVGLLLSRDGVEPWPQGNDTFTAEYSFGGIRHTMTGIWLTPENIDRLPEWWR